MEKPKMWCLSALFSIQDKHVKSWQNPVHVAESQMRVLRRGIFRSDLNLPEVLEVLQHFTQRQLGFLLFIARVLKPFDHTSYLQLVTLLTISSTGPHLLSLLFPILPQWFIRALMPCSALLVAPRGRTGLQGKPVQPIPKGKTAGLGPALTQAASPCPTTLSLSIRLRRKESRKRLI